MYNSKNMHPPPGSSIYFNVAKYIKLERLIKLNENAYKKISFIFILFELISLWTSPKNWFYIFEHKTISIAPSNYLLNLILLKVNNIIHTICYVNHNDLVILNDFKPFNDTGCYEANLTQQDLNGDFVNKKMLIN